MAVDLTTGSYDESGIFSKYNDISKPSESTPIVENLCTLKNFHVLNILKECASTKSVVVEGRFANDDRPAIVVVEKMPFDTRDLSRLFTAESRLELKFRNSIYANYHVYLQSGLNGINIQVIHPASEDDFLKYVEIPIVMVNESRELFEAVVKPYLETESLKQNNKIKVDPDSDNRILFDGRNESGFLLLKDEIEKCTCTSTHFRAKAVVTQMELSSLRDLTAEHIPLLNKLKEKSLEELCSKYKVPASKIESYIHYPPTTFPFHVFFETVEKDSLIKSEKAHHFETVLANLQLFPDYYQKVTLTYSLPEKGELLQKINARLS